MLILAFLLISLAAAAALTLSFELLFWKSALLFFACFLALHVLYLLFWGLVSLFVAPGRPLEKQNALCRVGVASMATLLCRYLRVRIHLTGEELLPPDGRFLLVCNHRSMFDPIVVFARLHGYNVAFVSKPSNLKIPIVGRLAYGMGCLPIDRENDRKALRTILTAADYLKRGLCSMAIYPEGTRSRTDELLPFHAGSFKIAQKAGVPLVIAAVRGSEEIRGRTPWRATDVSLDILRALPAEETAHMSTQELAQLSRGIMEQKLTG